MATRQEGGRDGGSLNGAKGGDSNSSLWHSRLICSCQNEGFPSSLPYLCCPSGCWCQSGRLRGSPALALSPHRLQCGSDRAAALHRNPVIMSIKGLKNRAGEIQTVFVKRRMHRYTNIHAKTPPTKRQR